MLQSFAHRSLSWQLGVLMLLVTFAGLCAVLAVARALAVQGTLSEARAVADMAQHVETWGSRYGELAVRLRGVNPARAGRYVEQRVYAASAQDFLHLAGTRVNPFQLDRGALERVDAYYIKNPALIQRELAEITRGSTARVQLRIVEAGVSNEFERPEAFERDALDAFRDGTQLEYHAVADERLLYAKPLGAPPAPMRIVSVSAVIPSTWQALSQGLGPAAWSALAAMFGMYVLLALFVQRRVVRPLERMRRYADDLSNAVVTAERTVPELGEIDAESCNEVDRLALAITALGASVRILFRKVRTRATAAAAPAAAAGMHT